MVCVLLTRSVTHAQTINTWRGGGYASVATNWSQGVPQAGHHIMLDGASSGNMTWNFPTNGLAGTVASWTQTADYTGTVTFLTRYPAQGGFTTFTVSGDCVISNGAWTHLANPATVTNINNELYRLRVTVGGALIMGAAGKIDATGKGYPGNQGPGYSANSGGSHGGAGGMGYPPVRPSIGACYGSVTAPTNLGSGGSSALYSGGGAVMFTVAGNIMNNGLVCADGLGGLGALRGAGGSVYLGCGALRGNGIIRANGGLSTPPNHSPGGGGRVALIQTSATDFSGYTGAIETYTGNTNLNYACCGTIYLEKQGDLPGRGELVVDNFGRVPFFRLATDINGIEPVTYEFSRITLTNAGCLLVGAGNTVLARTTVIESHGQESGIWLSGGTLEVHSGFAWSNFYVGVSATGSVFNPGMVASNAVFIVDAPHVIANDLIVSGGGVVTHSTNSTQEVNRLDLTVQGRLSVLAGGRIDAVGKGYGMGAGPGYEYGASHGGVGSAGAPTYGSLLAPTNLGSGGGFANSKGGGAVKLQVSGVLSNEGVISANGVEESSQRPASGGSVFITAGALAGTGDIQADATPSPGGAAGGGGRVSIVLTNSAADFIAFSGPIHAFGGSPGDALNAGAGTVYMQNGADRAGRGVVWVNNENRLRTGYTDVPPGPPCVTNELKFATLIVTNAATLRLTNDFAVGNVFLTSANATLNLGFNTLKVNAKEHPIGLGVVTNHGAIVWIVDGTIISIW